MSARPLVFGTIAELRAELDARRAAGCSVGFVPTMGFLHAGHASLMRAARRENDVVVVSIFVNPLQFSPSEDLAAYPRDLDRDLGVCEAEAVDVVFHPGVEEMYPEANTVTVSAGDIGTVLEGASRPGHFEGVATVVSKLFNIAGPVRAYFGEKDAQQLAVIRRLVSGLNFPVEVVGCPTVREEDGLAMSSRNSYLSSTERADAPVLKRALDEGARLWAAGERSPEAIGRAMRTMLASVPSVRVDYAACVHPETFGEPTGDSPSVLLAVAATVGKARLIDNVLLAAPHSLPARR